MKERKRRSVLQSARADGEGMRRPPGHLIIGSGREEVMRKGRGEEARSVRCMCDVCAAHGDRAAVGVDVDAQGSGLCQHESHFPLNARVECRAFVSDIPSAEADLVVRCDARINGSCDIPER